MKLPGWIQRSVPVAALALATAAIPTMAQYGQYGEYGQSPRYDQSQYGQPGQPLFEWNGRVDREIQLVLRGNNVTIDRVGSTEPRGGRVRMFGTLPRYDGQLTVQVIEGRGRVGVIQQPSRQNGYTAIVRIEDTRAGSDTYRFAGYWQGYSNGDVYDNGRVNRGRDRRDRDDVYRDRDDDDDRDDRNDRNDRNNRGDGGYGRYGNYGYPQSANVAMHWSGNVDDELEIRIQNGRVDYRTISGRQPTSIRADAGNLNMPRNAANVNVVQNQGRGTVFVAQQPSSWNGYTTVVRIRDPQGGYGFYDFSLIWR